MINEGQNGILLALATGLISYATTTFQTNFWQGIVAGAFGLGIIILREVLKSKGINIGNIKK
jgi:hypothetical protein